jgi:hypothetical protein
MHDFMVMRFPSSLEPSSILMAAESFLAELFAIMQFSIYALAL